MASVTSTLMELHHQLEICHEMIDFHTEALKELREEQDYNGQASEWDIAEHETELKSYEKALEFLNKSENEAGICYGTCKPAAMLFIPNTPEEIVRNEVFA